MKLGYSPWGNGHTIAPFDEIFSEKQDCFEHGFAGIDAFILWGGTDIHPSLYHDKPHRYSQAGANPSVRDKWEWQSLKYCLANNIPVIGVCRGAQMMCAFVGGGLFQHVAGHGSNHNMVTSEGEVINTTSAHHQMLDLRGTDHELLAWTPKQLSPFYYGEYNFTPENLDIANFKEPEVVFFPSMKGLAIQGHPEWADTASPFNVYVLGLVRDRLLSEVWA